MVTKQDITKMAQQIANRPEGNVKRPDFLSDSIGGELVGGVRRA